MSNEFEYTNSELIDLFIDGEASLEEKKRLFEVLSQDDSLVDEFQDALSIRNAAIKDADFAEPPLNLTNAIFSKAGFATIGAAAVGTAAAESTSNIIAGSASKGIFGFLGTKFTSLIAAGLIGAGSVFTYTQLSDNNKIEKLESEISSLNKILFSDNKPAYTIEDRTNLNKNNNQPIVRSYASKINSPIEDVADNNIDNISPIANNSFEVSNINKVDFVDLPLIRLDDKRIKIEANSNLLDFENTISVLPNKVHRFLVELNGKSGLLYLPSRTINEDGVSRFGNVSFAVFYEIDSKQFIGLEINNEIFPMYIKYTENNYAHKPYLFSAGFAYKYDMEDFKLLDLVSPYFGGFAGWSQAGAVVKAKAGLSWMPDARVKFNAGIEQTTLFYLNNTNLKQAGKVGFNYGFSVNF